MSRAFVKEDAQVDLELVPPRAPLPEGMPNWVTHCGWRMLLDEREAWQVERDRRQAEDGVVEALDERLDALSARIATARVVDTDVRDGVVRFGATVAVADPSRLGAGETRRLTVVGVDEADPTTGRVAFVSPVARALLGARVGDEVSYEVAGRPRRLRVVAIEADGG